MDIPIIVFWAIGILAFVLITTWLTKRFVPNAQTFYFVSMIKTKRPLPWFSKFAGRKRLLNLFGDVGLVLGFGAVGIDYIIGRKLGKLRIPVFIASALVLFEFFNVFFGLLLSNPFIIQYNFFLSLAFGIMGFSGFLIVSLAAYAEFIISQLLAGEKACPGVAPVIPGVAIPNFPVTVPLHGWISFVILLVVHEGMHGVLLRKAKLAIKSTGILLAGIFPIGAFVEPDEKQLQKAPEREQLRVYSAGPFANLAFAFILLLLLSGFAVFVASPVIGPWEKNIKQEIVQGIEIISVSKEFDLCGQKYSSPAFEFLQEGMLVSKVNGTEVRFLEEFTNARLSRTDFLELEVIDLNGITKQIVLEPNEIGRYGFAVKEKLIEGKEIPGDYSLYLSFGGELSNFFFWLFILSILIGIVNFLPMVPFDGGKIAQIVLLPYFGFLKKPKEETEKFITKFFFWVILILLLLNALPIFL